MEDHLVEEQNSAGTPQPTHTHTHARTQTDTCTRTHTHTERHIQTKKRTKEPTDPHLDDARV